MQEPKSGVRKKPAAPPLGFIVKVKPQPKKAKIDKASVEKLSDAKGKPGSESEKSPEPVKTSNGDSKKPSDLSSIGLVSYSDESEEDD